jgi:hypothetical protein
VSGLRVLPECTDEMIRQNPTAIRSKYLDPIDLQVHRVNQISAAIGTVYGDVTSGFDPITGAFTSSLINYGSDGTYETAAVNP